MFKNILVALDGSDLAEKILPYAEDLARLSGGVVTLLRVVQATVVASPLEAQGNVRQALLDEALTAEAYLEKIAKKLADKGVKTDTIVLQGDAATRIIDYAQMNDFDLICMTSHGRSGLARWVIGSVADKVSRRSLKPVLLVRVLSEMSRELEATRAAAA